MSAAKSRLRGHAHAAIYERFLYSDLSDKAVRLLCVLDRCQNRGIAYPGRQWLADKLGCSTDTVDRTLRELEDEGAIITTATKRPGGGRPMATYYVWPFTPEEDDQSRTDAELSTRQRGPQSRTHASTKPQTEAKTEGGTAYREQEKVKESDAAAPLTPTEQDPLKKQAHRLTVLAMEQPVKPELANGGRGAFPAAMALIERLLRSGRSCQEIERAITAGVEVWTLAGLQTAIAQTKPRARRGDGDAAAILERIGQETQ